MLQRNYQPAAYQDFPWEELIASQEPYYEDLTIKTDSRNLDFRLIEIDPFTGESIELDE